MQPQLASSPEQILGRAAPFLIDKIGDLAIGETGAVMPTAVLKPRRAIENSKGPRAVAAREAFGPGRLQKWKATA